MDKKLHIISAGNQAKAWALNLKDSNWEITVWMRNLETLEKDFKDLATLKGIHFKSLSTNCFMELPAINLALLIPDSEHYNFLQTYKLNNHSKIIYAHGYSCVYSEILNKFTNYQHELCAPKAIANSLREFFLQSKPIGGAILDNSKNIEFIKCLAQDLGLTYLSETSFKEECHADLFSEQSLLCTELIKVIEESFLHMKNSGINPDIAFMETFMEAKFILDTVFKVGPTEFYKKISPHALAGAHKALKSRESLSQKDYFDALWCDINSGAFEEWFSQADINEIRSEFYNYWSNSELEKYFKKVLGKANEEEFNNKENQNT